MQLYVRAHQLSLFEMNWGQEGVALEKKHLEDEFKEVA